MRGSGRKLYFSVHKEIKVWKDHVERIMNEENDWDHNEEGDVVVSPVVCVSREEVLQALNEMKTEETDGPSDVSLELIAVGWKVGTQVMADLCW